MAKRYVLGPNAARKLTELLRGSGGVSRRQGPASALAFDSECVAPFTVQWAQSVDSGSGAWLIWLPSNKCLIVDGAAIDLADGLDAAGDPYPTGWYVLEDVPASGGSVYLNVTPGDPEAAEEEDQVATAEFSASASQTEGDIPILVATASKDSTTGAVTVKQTVTSALVFWTGAGVNAGTATPMPFDYVETESESNGETVISRSLTRCQFYFDGELQTLSDYSGLPAGAGTVYLVCTGTYDDGEGEYEWDFEVANAQGSESTGVKVINVKLYDFAGGKPSVDYRSTFLTVESNAPPAKLTVAEPNGTCSILLDASGNSPKLEITDGTNTVSIDLADVANGCGGSFGLHELKYTDANGVIQTYHGLFCDNIDLSGVTGETPELPNIDVVTDISFSLSSGKIVAAISKKNIKTGTTSQTTTDVCNVSELDVVTSESYSTTTHAFTNVRKTIKVIGNPANATGQTPFTATAHSAEHGGS